MIPQGSQKENEEGTEKVDFSQKDNVDDEVSRPKKEQIEQLRAKILSRQKKSKNEETAVELTSSKDRGQKNELIDKSLKKAGLQIIGHTSTHEIVFWQKGRIKTFSARQLTKHDLVLLLGPSEMEAEDIKKYIIEAAWAMGIIDLETPLKQGVWRVNGKWLINTGKVAVQIKNEEIIPLETPAFEGRLLEFGKLEWVPIEELKRTYKDEAINLATVFNEIHAYVKQWNWKEGSMAEYATALVMLSVMQHALSWRPWIFILGPTYSGKTKFFECVPESIYLNLAERFDKTTAHALAQAIGNTGTITLLDEQDKNKKIEEVLELLKSSCRGGSKTSGTTGPKAHKYTLHHLVWLGAIYYPASILDDAAKQSRIIKLELNPVSSENRTVIREPEKDGKLAARILVVLIKNWDEINEVSRNIFASRGNKDFPQASDRTYENFQFPSAILSLVMNQTYTIPQWTAPSVESDELRILRAILTSPIEVSFSSACLVHKEKRLIAELLENVLHSRQVKDSKDALGRAGLALVNNGGDPYLAVDTDVLRRQVLKDTPFRDADIGGILKRLNGAKEKVAKIAGSSARAVLIPTDVLDSLLAREETPSCNLDVTMM